MDKRTHSVAPTHKYPVVMRVYYQDDPHFDWIEMLYPDVDSADREAANAAFQPDIPVGRTPEYTARRIRIDINGEIIWERVDE